MKDFLGRVRKEVGLVVGRLRENMLLLFVVALVFGGTVKVVASHFVTTGYNDYLTERQVGFDFVKMKKDVDTRKQEEDKKQAEAEQNGTDSTDSVTGGVCGG